MTGHGIDGTFVAAAAIENALGSLSRENRNSQSRCSCGDPQDPRPSAHICKNSQQKTKLAARRDLGERPASVNVCLIMHRLLVTLVLTGFFAFAASIAIAQRGGGGGSSTTAPRITTPSAPAPSTTSPAPQSATGAPMQRIQPVTPLSPSLQTPSTSSGGSTQGSTGSFGVGGTGSPSESAPSAPGGGGNTLQDCMNFWDSGTHMSKAQWRAACLRIQRRIGSAR